jgi:peptidoglycan/LPS O-acetylase OafA/YrhL
MASQTTNTPSSRLYNIDNLRIILSALVILVHFNISYGGPGGWIHYEKSAGLLGTFPLIIMNATSQSFFMGMFFLFAAYFTHLSYERKGLKIFLKDRFMRLGIPLIFYFFLISPLTVYVTPRLFKGASFLEVLMDGRAFGVGVMWFVKAIIYFSVLYLIARLIFKSLRNNITKRKYQINNYHVIILITIISLATFYLRTFFPVGKGAHDFDLAHFPQYIALFTIGIIAANKSLTEAIVFENAKKWRNFAIIMVVVGFPVLFFAGNALEVGIKPFKGGFNWQSLMFSTWEQFTGFAIMISLIGITKVKWNVRRKVEKTLADLAYAVYILHPPIIVAICLIFTNWDLFPPLKFLILSPVAIISCFAIAWLFRAIPGVKRFI